MFRGYFFHRNYMKSIDQLRTFSCTRQFTYKNVPTKQEFGKTNRNLTRLRQWTWNLWTSFVHLARVYYLPLLARISSCNDFLLRSNFFVPAFLKAKQLDVPSGKLAGMSNTCQQRACLTELISSKRTLLVLTRELITLNRHKTAPVIRSVKINS